MKLKPNKKYSNIAGQSGHKNREGRTTRARNNRQGERLVLKSCRVDRYRFGVRIERNGEVLFTGELSPYRAKEIEVFVRRARRSIPGLRAEMPAAELRAQLLRLAAPASADDARAAAVADHGYASTPEGLVWTPPTPGAIPVVLTNFDARIVEDMAVDDGARNTRHFHIEAKLAGTAHRFMVPAASFSGMTWTMQHMGPTAIVRPGRADHARTAIQMLSAPVHTVTAFAHTGWREVGGRWVYLHAAGAVGATGLMPAVKVFLPDQLAAYALPAPPCADELIRCIRASLRVLDIAADEITFPVFSAIWRAVLGECDGSVFITGPSGAWKSELAALCQQHFGQTLDRLHLPAAWSATDAALESLASSVKDALLVVDDFAPTGTSRDIQRLHQKADHCLRAQGNHAGRARMGYDGVLLPERPPRALILSTGEDVPRGASLRARLLVVEIGPKNVDLPTMTLCQSDACIGSYSAAMSGYLCWLADRDIPSGEWRICRVWRTRGEEVAALRDEASASGMHGRTPALVANLALGLRYFLAFAQDAGAISKGESMELWKRGWKALRWAATRQISHQSSSDPAFQFMESIASALASGKAHLVASDGGPPPEPAMCGWRPKVGTNRARRSGEYEPQGTRIGWTDKTGVYLISEASYRAAQEAAGQGEAISVSAQTLRKRLFHAGLLVREGRRDELLVRRMFDGASRRVLYLKPGSLMGR